LFPTNSEKNIFDHFHNVAHPGRLASRCIISSRFVWRGLTPTGVWPASRARSTATHAWSPPHPHPLTVFSHLHVDLVAVQ
jgi:hypothetical protein